MTDAQPNPRPRRLGRGLSALIGDPVTPPVSVTTPIGVSSDDADAAQDSGVPRSTAGLRGVPIAEIDPSPFQPRRAFDETELDQLAASITRSGVMQPIIVRMRGDRYELVAGERRWRAATRAGLDTIPALVRTIDDETAAEWALVENLQRTDLNAIEKARALRGLIDRFGITQGEAADRVGIDRSSVANLVRLLDLDPPLQDMIEQGLLSLGHGKALLTAPANARLKLAERCVREAWSVRRLERETSGGPLPSASTAAAPTSAATEPPADPADPADPAIADLERRLSEHLGTKVAIRPAKESGKGTVTLSYFSLDHFDDLMSRVGFTSSDG